MGIKENLKDIKNKINAAEKRAGRKADSVKLVAVSKYHTVDDVYKAIEAGQFLFGENRVQEAGKKFLEIKEKYKNVELHLLGVLQSNKVKNAVKIADCIESVDRIEILEEIEKQCAKIDKKIKVFFELHTGEDSKSGYKTEDLLLESIKACADGRFPHVIPCGLMTMAPFTNDEKLIRDSFRALQNLLKKIDKKYPQFDMKELSMGMSGDYEIAVEEGATIVRIGTAIFGERVYSKNEKA